MVTGWTLTVSESVLLVSHSVTQGWSELLLLAFLLLFQRRVPRKLLLGTFLLGPDLKSCYSVLFCSQRLLLDTFVATFLFSKYKKRKKGQKMTKRVNKKRRPHTQCAASSWALHAATKHCCIRQGSSRMYGCGPRGHASPPPAVFLRGSERHERASRSDLLLK